MAITLEANYSKKIGLPGFSSHQYAVTLRTEIPDLKQVEAESRRLYRLLQDAVDREIREVGFLPGRTETPANGNGNNGNGSDPLTRNQPWACSDKQKALIVKLVDEDGIAPETVTRLAQDRFNAPVAKLNKLETSGLIDELLEKAGKRNGSRNGVRRVPEKGGAR
jgi:hypothetical protein